VATRAGSDVVVQRSNLSKLAILSAAALVGAADAGLFIATDPQTALKTPGRAAGSLAGLAVWILLLAVSGRRWRGGDNRRLAAAGLGLSLLAALDGVGLAAVHAMARVGGARTLVGGAAGLTALGLALSARRGDT
jgi:hypothetical protein